MDLLLKNGAVVTPDGVVRADLGTEGERIVYLGHPEVGETIHPRETLDCSGCLLFPGAIDAHVQLEVSFGRGELGDDFYTGSRAAACGGVTTLVDYARQQKGGRPARSPPSKKRGGGRQGRDRLHPSSHAGRPDARGRRGGAARLGGGDSQLQGLHGVRQAGTADGRRRNPGHHAGHRGRLASERGGRGLSGNSRGSGRADRSGLRSPTARGEGSAPVSRRGASAHLGGGRR